jgi:hypothetical protein
MFSIAVDPTYTTPVKGELAGGLPVEFEAHFRRLTVTQYEALRTEIREQGLSDAAVIKRVLAGWSGVVDADQVPVPFGPEALGAVLDIAGVQALIVEAFFESFSGARRKN